MNAVGTVRPVITGIGVVAPTGIGRCAHWKNTLGREPRLRPLPGDVAGTGKVRVAGIVEGFDEADFIPRQLAVRTDRWTWLALAAADLAIADAELPVSTMDPHRLSVILASSSGGNAFGQRQIQALWRDGPASVSAYQSIAWFYAASAGQLSIRYGMKGRCAVTVADGAGTLSALVTATGALRRREVDAVLVGGTEAPLSPYALACHSSLDTVSKQDLPGQAFRPFTTAASGFVPGEGGAILVLESLHGAVNRGAATCYAEIAAVARTHDAHHPTRPPVTARCLNHAIEQALARAGLGPEEIDVIFPDAMGDPVWDALEVDALRAVFGPRLAAIPLAVPKSMTGRLNSGGAALDLSWAALALFHDAIPPMADPGEHPYQFLSGLDPVEDVREGMGLRHALVVARGSGGFNAAAVLRSIDGVDQ